MHDASANTIAAPAVKAVTAIGAASAAKFDVADQVVQAATVNSSYTTWELINSIPWGTIASVLAATYTFLLISEWFWKKVWRPIAEHYGWIKPKLPRLMTPAEWDAYKREQERPDTDRAPL